MYFFLRRCALFSAIFLALLCVCVEAQDKDWRPVTSEEIQMKTPTVEPDADAEAIFWEVRVDDSAMDEVALRHYVRVKIFTDRGREEFIKHDIYFSKNMRIKDVEARVTKPDGTVTFLKKDDVIEHEIVKANGIKIKAKSFALPGLEIGSVLEYRYREITDNGSANMRLIFQRDIPIRTISYYIRPYAGDRAMAYYQFNVGETKFEKDKDGYYRTTANNVKAFHEEPSMLPEDEVKKWMYIYYTRDTSKDSNEYWGKVSKGMFEAGKNILKPNDDVKKATEQLLSGASSDEEKIHRIFDFTKTQIRNISYADNVIDDERKKVKDSHSPSDTLKLKMGSASDVDQLFGAMARAAGFDARIALSGDRSELFFDPHIANVELMLNSSSIAVKLGSDWKFFSPASYYVPYGMLTWVEEDQKALITDPKEMIWKEIPLSPASRSMEKRSGHFKLLDDGTLEGEARIEFSGHYANREKVNRRNETQQEKEDQLKALIRSNLTGAEVDGVSVENDTDPEKPLIYKFKVRVPGYASRTGKRIFFQPNVFERNSKPRFTANDRRSDIYFPYPFGEADDITIDLPAGFVLENADSPGPIADSQGIGSHKTDIGISKDGKQLLYSRQFSFGNGGLLRFPAASYAPLKGLFEAFNKADVHQLTLRQETKQ